MTDDAPPRRRRIAAYFGAGAAVLAVAAVLLLLIASPDHMPWESSRGLESSSVQDGSARGGLADGTSGLSGTSGANSGDGDATSLAPGPAAPAGPLNLTGVSGPGTGEVTLTWTPPAGATNETNYTVERTSTNGTTTSIETTNTTYVDKAPTPGAAYTYTVYPAPSPTPQSSPSAPASGGSTPPSDAATPSSDPSTVTVLAQPGAPAIPTPELPAPTLLLVGAALVLLVARSRRV